MRWADALSVLTGFGSGVVIAGAVYAFIAVVGIVPRLAQKTETTTYIILYEEMIILGGILGGMTLFIDFRLPLGNISACIYGLTAGVFFGVLAVSLAEVIDVIPILVRRGKIREGMKYFILAIALGKFAGSCLYYLIPGFFE